MPDPKLFMLVKEEPVSPFGPAAIPTLGARASNFDAYRTVGIAEIHDSPASWCFTDTDAAAALGRLIDGQITSYKDIERAESALRALLLHEFVEVIVPCVKAQQVGGFNHYLRFDYGERNDAAFSAFEIAPSRDCLFATEYVKVANGQITESNNPESALLGMPVDATASRYRTLLDGAKSKASAFPMDLGAFTYYTAPELADPLNAGHAGFIDQLYSRVYRPWVEFAQEPPLYFDIKLPPLLSIALSRANSRATLPTTLKELREELGPARADLNALNDLRNSSALSQADVYALQRRINEAFDAIVPEALLTTGERRKRRLLTAYNCFRSALKAYTIAANPMAVTEMQLLGAFNAMRDAVATQRIVARSVTAATMAELLRIESMQNLLTTHFTDVELRLLEQAN